jgi:hypothetical protein
MSELIAKDMPEPENDDVVLILCERYFLPAVQGEYGWVVSGATPRSWDSLVARYSGYPVETLSEHDKRIRREALIATDEEVKAVADELAAWNFDVAMNSCITINGASADFSSRSFELLAKRVLNAAYKAAASSRERES